MKKNSMGQKTKGRILDAALLLFNEKGFENVLVEEISVKADITKAMVYYHFESKEAIMLELVKRLLESIKADIKNKSAQSSQREMMYNHIGEMIDLWNTNKEIGLFIITKGIRDDAIFSRLLEIAKSFYGQLFENEKNSGLKPKDDIFFEKYFKLLMFNTLPMISLPVISNKAVAEFGINGEKLKMIFQNEFIRILDSILES